MKSIQQKRHEYSMSNETSLITKNKKKRKLDGVNHCNEERKYTQISP